MRSLIILAAGEGTRLNLGYNKLLYKLKNNKTILQTTLDIFYESEVFEDIIIVINKKDEEQIKNICQAYEKIKLVYGGNERHISVHLGIKNCKHEYVYIHDGARCNFSSNNIQLIEETLKKDPNLKCLALGVKPKDTIQKIDSKKYIKHALNREELIQIQTPQIISKSTYLNIYNKNNNYTDESTLFFKNNYKVLIIEGSYENLKITTKEDLEYYEYIKSISSRRN